MNHLHAECRQATGIHVNETIPHEISSQRLLASPPIQLVTSGSCRAVLDQLGALVETETFLKNLGAAVAAQRRARKLTQEKLAEKLSTSAEWISQVERGVGRPSVEMLLNIAGALEVSAAALVELACGEERALGGAMGELVEVALPLDERQRRLIVGLARVVADQGRG